MVKLSRFSMLAICIGLGCLLYAARGLYWRPVMPAVTVEARNATTGSSSQLIVIYGEHGHAPLRSGTLAADERIASCETTDGICLSQAARHELKLGLARRQSLQIRRLDGHGNPIVGRVVWFGPAYPRVVRLTCDLSAPGLGETCRIVTIEA